MVKENENDVLENSTSTTEVPVEKTKRNKVQLTLPVIALLVFLLGIGGGFLGALLYNDYSSGKISKGIFSNTNVNVKENSGVIDAVNKITPSVVSITGTASRNTIFGTSESQSSGTGFIVSSDGLIVTNKHVVSDKNTTYAVILNDGKEYAAEVKALDPSNDIAIVKINATGLTPAVLGNSDNLQIGQTAIAVGNALGQYQNSVTVGVISGIGRAIQAGDSSGSSVESLDNVIQTDAAINPGNSGGPLVNIAGLPIGMNTAVDQQAQGIGFAIPINMVKSALDSYLAKGEIVRPMLGVSYVPITKEIATRNSLPVSSGAYIYNSNGAAVVAGSPAAAAGLKQGDIITKINDTAINQTHSLVSVISNYNVGDTVKVTYLRDGKENTVEIKLVANK